MTDHKRLARNAMVNLFGQVAPMAAALVSIPWLIRGMGTDRYGVLLLAWAVVGYFGFVDLGLGRALTHAIASRLGHERERELDDLAWTALVLMFALGAVGGLALALGAETIADRALDLPAELRSETVRALYILGAALPIVVSTAGLRGVLEAHQDFGLAIALRVPLAIFSYVGPLAALPFSHRLDVVILVLVAGRFVTWGAHLAVCVRRYWYLRRPLVVRRSVIVPLLRVGGWMTVSNVVSPLMTYVDRFFISALLPVAAVAYYATPYEAVSKLLIFPTAVVGVLFPAFAEAWTKGRDRASALFDSGIRAIVLCLFPCVLVLAALPHEILTVWLHSAPVADAGAPVLRWLAIGVLINSIAYVPFVALQGAGRADITGKLNLLELPLYAGAIWTLTHALGITGVAIAWTSRVAVDAALLAIAARRYVVEKGHFGINLIAWTAMAAALAACFALPTTAARLAFVAATLAGYVPVVWTVLMTSAERHWVKALVVRVARGQPAVEGT